MRKLQTIGVIGRVTRELVDGQTVKTRILVEELKKAYPDCRIQMAETGNYKANPLRLLVQLVKCVRESDVIFVLLSRNGVRVIFPILDALNRIYKKPIVHDCIGGTQDRFLAENPKMKRYYNRFRVNFVETEGLKRRMEAQGLTNVEVLPNFKPLKPMSPRELTRKAGEPYRFCTFSRVIRDKGITAAAEAVMDINRDRGRMAASLDIYGPFEGDYGTELDGLIRASGGAVTYKGVADYRQSVAILKDYDMLLFPTYFRGEGFPGTLIDAFSAGLPVIASDWNCNGEIIRDGVTGWIYSLEQPMLLRQRMEEAMADPEAVYEMRLRCLEEAKRYSADEAMKTVCRRIEQELGLEKVL